MDAWLLAVARRVQGRVGLAPPRWFLGARLADRAVALGLSLEAYLRELLAAPEDAPELAWAIEALRVGETRFFRHPAQTTALRAGLPARLFRAQAAGRSLRVWCAGCASGEE